MRLTVTLLVVCLFMAPTQHQSYGGMTGNAVSTALIPPISVSGRVTTPPPSLPSDIPSLIRSISQRVPGFPADLALTIAERESGFDPKATHLNINGTVDWGIMQINDVMLGPLGITDPLDAVQNVSAGVGYLQKLWGMFEGDPDLIRRQKVECVYGYGARGCLVRIGGE